MAKLSTHIISPLKSLRKEARKSIIDPFWWILIMAIVFYVPFLRPWWWIFAPLFLSMELRTLYLWWIAWDFDYPKIQWIVLEITPPREILTPIKAMEDVFAGMWGPLVDNANFREIWCDGELDNTPYWMSFELVSIEGDVHFLARINSKFRSMLESNLYAHYPAIEIREVPDYARNVPQNIPNKEWGFYGEDFILPKPAAYPIKTYEKSFEPQGEKISAEEKRMDPINSLLEAMSRLGKGEQYWIQYIMSSITDSDEPGYRKEAEEIISKLANRSIKKSKSFIEEVFQDIINIIVGPKAEKVGDKVKYKFIQSSEEGEEGEREMVLTPGEREIMNEIENKLKKPAFRTTVRGMYVAKMENWHSANRLLLRTYMSHIKTENLNDLRFSTITRTRVHDVFRERRVFLRARRMFKNAVLRFPPLFPDRRKENAILNTEELASLFHLPIRISSLNFPTIERVEHRKGGPPANLPIEQ